MVSKEGSEDTETCFLCSGHHFCWVYMKLKMLVAQFYLTLCDPMDCSPPGFSVRGSLQARILEWIAMPSSRGPPDPGIEPRFPALQLDSLPSEIPGKPKNTGVGSLSRLQQIFPTQESNRDLPHCRWILYQLNCQGSPGKLHSLVIFSSL